MPFLPLRPVPLADTASSLYEEWLASVDEALGQADCDRNELCRRILTDLHFPTLADIDPGFSVQTVSVGVEFLLVPLSSAEAV